MTAADNLPQKLASSVTRGFTGSSGRPELIRHSDGRLHQYTANVITGWVLICGPLSFKRNNFVNMLFICAKISRPKHEIIMCGVLPEYPELVLRNVCNSMMSEWRQYLFTCCKNCFHRRGYSHCERTLNTQQATALDLCLQNTALWFSEQLSMSASAYFMTHHEYCTTATLCTSNKQPFEQ